MSDIQQLLALLQNDKEEVDRAMNHDLEDLASRHDARLIEILRYGLLGGGKKLRPLLAVVASRICGDPGKNVFLLAAAFEYLHVATLFHDDVIDQAETRRGTPSVYKVYGMEGAILAGDFLHAHSMEIVGKYGGKECLAAFCRATTGMVDGEFLQLRNADNYSLSPEDYYRTIEGKTALLISAALEVGAMDGGASVEQREALAAYGRYLGYGFQIADDLLDYRGDTEKTGKAVGNDLCEGKMTLPLILALTQAQEEQRDMVIDLLKDRQRRSTAFATIHDFIEGHNGFHMAERAAWEFIEKAEEKLQIFNQDSEGIAILKGIARYAMEREK